MNKYTVRLDRYNFRVSGCWSWTIIGRNGVLIQRSDLYQNKAQCRNVGKKFAEYCGLEWRE